jgi:hypothetical protein
MVETDRKWQDHEQNVGMEDQQKECPKKLKDLCKKIPGKQRFSLDKSFRNKIYCCKLQASIRLA